MRLVRIKEIDGIPCIVLDEDEQEKVKNIKPENQFNLQDYTQLQRSKELENIKDVMKDLKENFKNKQKSLL